MVNLIDLILYIQSIFWFISAGYLTYLINKNKLTYVDEFRQKFVIGVYFLLLNVAIIVIFNIIFKIQAFLLLLYSVMFLADVIFITLTLIGTSKLIDYVSSIIEFETKNKKKNAIIISVIVTIFASIINIFFKITPTISITDYILFSIAILFFCFAAMYFLYLHQELKKININILRYFGIGILFLFSTPFPSIFIDFNTDMMFWIIVFFGLIGLNFTLILGYLDFKNKISKGLAK